MSPVDVGGRPTSEAETVRPGFRVGLGVRPRFSAGAGVRPRGEARPELTGLLPDGSAPSRFRVCSPPHEGWEAVPKRPVENLITAAV